MKYKDVLTGETIDKFKTLYARVKLNETSIGDKVLVQTPFELTNALPNVVKDEGAEKELEEVKSELNKVKLQRRELKKEVKELKNSVKELEKELEETKKVVDYYYEMDDVTSEPVEEE